MATTEAPKDSKENLERQARENEHAKAASLENAKKAVGTEAYEILDVPRNASDAEIKKAYRKAAIESHPDKHGGNGDAFRKVGQAFELLSEDRGNYDKYVVEEQAKAAKAAKATEHQEKAEAKAAKAAAEKAAKSAPPEPTTQAADPVTETHAIVRQSTELGEPIPVAPTVNAPRVTLNTAMNLTVLGSAITQMATQDLSTGEKVVVGTQAGLGAGGIIAEARGLNGLSTTLGGVGGVFAMGTSAMGFADAYERGDGFGMTMNAAGFASGTSFAVAGGSAALGGGEALAYLNPVGAVIGTGVIVASTVKQYIDYGETKEQFGHLVEHDDKVRAHDNGTPSINANYADLTGAGQTALPIKPKLSEYNKLTRYDAEHDHVLQKALDKGDMATVKQLLNNPNDAIEYGKLQAERDAANASNYSILGTASPLRKIFDWNGEERNMEKVSNAEAGMGEILLKQGAAKELAGNFEKRENGFTPRGLTERMTAYDAIVQKGHDRDQQHFHADKGGYTQQLAKLEVIPAIQMKVAHTNHVSGMEAAMGLQGSKEDEAALSKAKFELASIEKKYNGTGYMETVAGKHGGSAQVFHAYSEEQLKNIQTQKDAAKAHVAEAEKTYATKNPELLKERAFFEKEIAPGVEEAFKAKQDAEVQQRVMEADLAKGTHEVSERAGRGGATRKVTKEYTDAEKTDLKAKIAEGQKHVAEMEKAFAEKSAPAKNYVASKLAAKQAEEEFKTVTAMKPEERAEYFAKNKQFIEDANLQGRQDLVLAGMSTSPEQMMANVVQFAPSVVAEQSASEAKTMQDAVARATERSGKLKEQMKGFEEKGIKPGDAPLLDQNNKPLLNKEGKPITYADLQTELQGRLDAQTAELKQWSDMAAKYDTKDLKARVTIVQTQIAATEMMMANNEANNLSYKVAVAQTEESKQQGTQQAAATGTETVLYPKAQEQRPHFTAKGAHLQENSDPFASAATEPTPPLTKGPDHLVAKGGKPVKIGVANTGGTSGVSNAGGTDGVGSTGSTGGVANAGGTSGVANAGVVAGTGGTNGVGNTGATGSTGSVGGTGTSTLANGSITEHKSTGHPEMGNDLQHIPDVQALTGGFNAIAKGDGGTGVAAVQLFLNEHRDAKHQIKVDGKMGHETTEALVAYQKEVAHKQRLHGEKPIEADGMVGKDTFIAMQKDGLDKVTPKLQDLMEKDGPLKQTLASMDKFRENIKLAAGGLKKHGVEMSDNHALEHKQGGPSNTPTMAQKTDRTV